MEKLVSPAERYEAIKAHYLGLGRTEAQWAEVCQSPAKFNRVWRHWLGLPPGETPPKCSYCRHSEINFGGLWCRRHRQRAASACPDWEREPGIDDDLNDPTPTERPHEQ